MDRRNEELKILKKAYKRERRSATVSWKLLFVLSLVAFLVLVPLGLQCFFTGTIVAAWIENGIGALRAYVPGLYSPLNSLMAMPNIVAILLGIAALVLLVSVIMWIAGSRKLKRTDAFLSYRTLRETLKEEKKYQS